MKTKPAMLVALIAVAVAVSGEFAVAANHAARAGANWFGCVRSAAQQETVSCLVKAGAGALVRWAKS